MTPGRPPVRMDDLTVERVLRTVECIPAGRVAPYGVVGGIAGVGPRLVGRILSTWGSASPWWRVPNAHGDFPAALLPAVLPHWRAEGIPVRPDGRGCPIADLRADLDRLERDAHAAWSDLPSDLPPGQPWGLPDEDATGAPPAAGGTAITASASPAPPHSTGRSSRK